MTETLSNEKTELFETMPVRRAVLKLSVPTVVGSLVAVLYSLTDTLFVGMLNDPNETSAVTLAASVILLFNAVTNLFGVGTASNMSRALGRKDYATVRRTSAFGFWAAAILALLFSLLAFVFQRPLTDLLGASDADRMSTLAYLRWTVFFGAVPSILNVVLSNLVRSEGAALHATVGAAGGCLLNIILDPFFILPRFLGLGAEGAGLATFLSNTAACLYFFGYLAVKKSGSFVTVAPRKAIPTKEIVKEVMGVGIPASIQNILNVTGMTLLNNRMALYGTEAVAAMGICHKVAMLPMYFSMGIGQGIMPLVGYNYAAGNSKRIKGALNFTVKLSAGIVLAITAAFIIFPDRVVSLFMENERVVDCGSAFLRGLAAAEPFLALDFLAVGVFQACGKGGYSLAFAVARKIALEIPAILILDRLFPMYGPAWSQLVAEVVLAFAAVILLKRLLNSVRDRNPEEPG